MLVAGPLAVSGQIFELDWRATIRSYSRKMIEPSLDTRPSLLIRLRDHEDREAWRFFVEAYAPLISAFLRRHGIQEADALDVVQNVLVAVASGIRRFEHRKSRCGSFRSWLYTLVRHRMADYWRSERRQPSGGGDDPGPDVLAALPADDRGIEEQWNREFQLNLFHSAAGQIKDDFQETSWQAFWRTAVQQQAAQPVADELGISVAAVYMAKRRILQRIREQIEFLQGDMS
jgi:RNA polymerase sigma-70 factor (ECF subfamily)